MIFIEEALNVLDDLHLKLVLKKDLQNEKRKQLISIASLNG
jgi:hypothetical protein